MGSCGFDNVEILTGSHAARSLWPEQFENFTGAVRRSAGIGPRADTISAIHGRSITFDRNKELPSTSFC